MTDSLGAFPEEEPDELLSTTSSYVVIFDIVAFSEVDPHIQAEWVQTLLERLNVAIATLPSPVVLPTGDGAIVCLREETAPKTTLAAAPIDFSRELLRLTASDPFSLRIAINYSGVEHLLDVSEYPFLTIDSVQIGNGINMAERIIHFAEPAEIVFTGEYFERLRSLGLLSTYASYPHRNVFVKHMRPLPLFSYKPGADESAYIYSPCDAEEQHFKRFAYFPPLTTETIERFRVLNLRPDLEQLCSYAYDTVAAINRECTFISWGGIYDVLKNIPTEGEDEVLVLGRGDLDFNFWSTPESKSYLSRLRVESRKRGFNQKRVILYRPGQENTDPIPPDARAILAELHAAGTLLQLDVAYARGNVLLNYIFGVTIYPTLGCAVAPIPAAESYDDYLETIRFQRPQDAFKRYAGADFRHTGFKALVIADRETVENLALDFDKLRGHRATEIVD